MFFTIRSLLCLGLLVTLVADAAPWIPRGASLTEAWPKHQWARVETQGSHSVENMPFQLRDIKNPPPMRKLYLARDEAGYQGSEERILLKALYDRAKEVDRTRISDSPLIKESAATQTKDRCSPLWYCEYRRRAFIPRPLSWQRQHKPLLPRDPEEKQFGQRFPEAGTYVGSVAWNTIR